MNKKDWKSPTEHICIKCVMETVNFKVYHIPCRPYLYRQILECHLYMTVCNPKSSLLINQSSLSLIFSQGKFLRSHFLPASPTWNLNNQVLIQSASMVTVYNMVYLSSYRSGYNEIVYQYLYIFQVHKISPVLPESPPSWLQAWLDYKLSDKLFTVNQLEVP